MGVPVYATRTEPRTITFSKKKKTGKERVVAMQAHVTRASGQGFVRHCIHQLLQFVTQQCKFLKKFIGDPRLLTSLLSFATAVVGDTALRMHSSCGFAH